MLYRQYLKDAKIIFIMSTHVDANIKDKTTKDPDKSKFKFNLKKINFILKFNLNFKKINFILKN